LQKKSKTIIERQINASYISDTFSAFSLENNVLKSPLWMAETLGRWFMLHKLGGGST